MNRIILLALCASAFCLAACGYQFQGRRNPLHELGINRIYVEQFRNDTYRPGVEQLFSSAMIREIQKSRAFTLVNDKAKADAVMSGVISTATSIISSPRQVEIKNSAGQSVRQTDIAAEYNAQVQCDVRLTDPDGRVIFAQSASGNKIHPGSTDTGPAGATVSLVNESEQRLAIQFIASQMMASVYQRMIDNF
jgi:outer membrane lipopolysaccharide assembly protein LptE/RlpB